MCSSDLTEWAKNHDAIIVFVAHVTKDGFIAGPKAAEHIVDAVLAFEQAEGELRALRATKNRYGSTDELGLYRMGPKGLEEITDPTGILLVRRAGELPPGAAVAMVHEGSRILLVELQALTVPESRAHPGVFRQGGRLPGGAHRGGAGKTDRDKTLRSGSLYQRGGRPSIDRTGHRPCVGRRFIFGQDKSKHPQGLRPFRRVIPLRRAQACAADGKAGEGGESPGLYAHAGPCRTGRGKRMAAGSHPAGGHKDPLELI